MKILAIGAHLDDIELGCGGTLALAIKNGHKVKCIIMCESDYSNFDGTVLRTKEESTVEGRAALEKLGVKDYVVYDFPNKFIPYDGTTVESIDKIMTEFKPDLVLTHWTFDTHQDHRNVAMAAISAARYQNNILMFEPFPPSGRSYHPFRTQVYVDISDVLPIKLGSMSEHKSQLKKYGADWFDSIESRAHIRGYESGCKYAEVFEMVRYKLEL